MSSPNTATYTIKSFVGGMTDEYLSASPDQYQRMDNLLLNNEGDAISRPGSDHFGTVAGGEPVNAIIDYNQGAFLLAQSNKKVFFYTGGAFTEIKGPNNNSVFSAGNVSSRISQAQWKGQLYLTNGDGSSVMKVFQSGAASFTVLNAGLPRYPDGLSAAEKATLLASAITLANNARTAMMTHFPSTLQHKSAHNYVFAAAATNEATLITLTNSLVAGYTAHIIDARKFVGAVYHQNDPANGYRFTASFGHFFLPERAVPTTLLECLPVLNDLKRNFNYHADSYVADTLTYGSVTNTIDTSSHATGVSTINEALIPLDNSATPIPLLAPTISVQTGVNAGFTGSGRQALYTWANELRIALSLHYADAAAQGGHPAVNSDDKSIVAITNDHSLILGFYKIVQGYCNHRLRNAAHAAGAEAGTTVPSDAILSLAGIIAGVPSVAYYSTVFFHPLRALDPTSATDLNTIYTTLVEIYNKVSAHVTDATRHILAAFSGIGDYYASGKPLLQLGTFANYKMALLYRNRFTPYGQAEFEDKSAPFIFSSGPVLQYLGVLPVGVSSAYLYDTITNITITGFSTLPTTENHPSSTATIQIYRSVANDTVLHLVGEIPNGTATFSDTMSDAAAALQQTIYTTGGILDNDPPPKAKYLQRLGNKLYYGNFVDEYGNAFPNRIAESLEGTFGAVPGASYVDLPQAIVGVSATKSNLIAFTYTHTYRIEGGFDILGRGFLREISISDQTGLVASYSPIQIDDGVIFWGKDGPYFTDGYTVRPIGTNWLTTYKSLTTAAKAGRIQGALDTANGRAWWTTEVGSSGAGNNNSAMILGLKQGVRANSCFMSASNYQAFPAASIGFFAGEMYRGTYNGQVLKHSDDYTYDIIPGTTVKAPIQYDLRPVATDFGDGKRRKWVSSIVATFRNRGSVSVQINSINDDGKSLRSLTPIRWRGKPTYGAESVVKLNSDSPGWGNRGLIEARRRFPAGTLRCITKQLQLTLAKVVITNSDALGFATVNPVAKTATLLVGAWPADMENHKIHFSADGYIGEFTIVSVAGAVLTFAEAGGPVAHDYEWVIRGYPKDERFHLLSLTVNYVPFDEQQSAPRQGELGENE